MKSLVKSGAQLISQFIPSVAIPIACGPLVGHKFILHAMEGKSGGASVYAGMFEREQTAAFCSTVKIGGVVFDVGANVGYYALLSSTLVGESGRVVAFEPVVRNIHYLHRHVKLNRLRNVTILPTACSDATGATLFSAGRNSAEGHLTQGSEDILSNPVVTVSVDDFVSATRLSPNVLKIDVEGAEHLVLKGASATLEHAKPAVFLSTHSDDLRHQCLEYLAQRGYTHTILSFDRNNPYEFLCT
jgi:FkbM family methyltransferase